MKVNRIGRLNGVLLGLTVAAAIPLVSGCGAGGSTPAGLPSSSASTPKKELTPTPPASPILSGVRACTATQLTMKYFGGGVGAGNNFGTVAVLNHSGTACMWRGRVSVVPLTQDQQFMGANGQAATTTGRVMTATANGIPLSAHGYVVDYQPAPTGDHYGQVILSGDARDDNSPNGLCSPANQIRPAYWGIATLGQKFTVANYDRANAKTSRNFFVGVTACHAHFGMSVTASY